MALSNSILSNPPLIINSKPLNSYLNRSSGGDAQGILHVIHKKILYASKCTYLEVKNVSFSVMFEYVINGCSPCKVRDKWMFPLQST